MAVRIRLSHLDRKKATTWEPGASDVLTQGFRVSPRSTAFFATRAAPSITEGLEVLVQEVMDATVTAPFLSSKDVPSARVTGTEASGVWV